MTTSSSVWTSDLTRTLNLFTLNFKEDLFRVLDKKGFVVVLVEDIQDQGEYDCLLDLMEDDGVTRLGFGVITVPSFTRLVATEIAVVEEDLVRDTSVEV